MIGTWLMLTNHEMIVSPHLCIAQQSPADRGAVGEQRAGPAEGGAGGGSGRRRARPAEGGAGGGRAEGERMALPPVCHVVLIEPGLYRTSGGPDFSKSATGGRTFSSGPRSD